MSFWDVSFSPAIPGTSTPPSQPAEQHSPTLNDEVTEVFGQLERFWGGFRKQGQTAIHAARKDLGDYVSQAQKGINNQLAILSVSTPVPAADADVQPTASSSTRDLADSITTDGGESSSTSSSTSASTATLPDPQQQQQQVQQQQQQQQHPQERAWSPTQTLFTRLQSSLPPDLLTTIRDTIPIPDSVRDPQARMDLAHAAQARVQGAAARGEELLRGASVLFRDAVRVVPPDPQTAASSASHSRSASGSAPLGEASGASTVPATRRGALLRALRSNSAILRVDPAGEERSAVLFAAWVDAAGRDIVRDESRREPELAADDGVLRSTLSTLVPGELSEDVFWTRYFFRVHQINQEDEQRRAVLSAGPAEQDEDFSWEDEEEDAAPKEHLSPAPPIAPVLNRDRQQSGANATSGSMSPQRSDDSFDIVSSGRASAVGDAGAAPVHTKETSDGDEDEEDEDEDEEDEEESDWE